MILLSFLLSSIESDSGQENSPNPGEVGLYLFREREETERKEREGYKENQRRKWTEK